MLNTKKLCFGGLQTFYFNILIKKNYQDYVYLILVLFLVLIQYFSDMYCEVDLESLVSEFVDIVHICMLLTFTANCIRKWA